ncbi:hypothetical protein V8B97DRAFT_2109639 [Scleroderma yunnanense]
MCLISVKTLLGMGRAFMKGGRVTPHFKVLEELDDARPSYAILSHRWGQGINYGELTQLPKVGEEDGSEFRNAAKFHGSNSWLEWFSRGWTLEELIAPKGLQFFKRNWEKKLRIHSQIMSWAACRETTREDRAYSLLGPFGVHMSMLYEEGKNAFQCLQLEIIRMSNDQSIFAWGPNGKIQRIGSVLADDPSFFKDCHVIVNMEPDRLIEAVKGDIAEGKLERRTTQFFGAIMVPRAIAEFRQLFIDWDEMSREFTFTFDDKLLSNDLTHCGRFPPRESTFNSITLTGTGPLLIVVYSNSDNNARFAVGFGYFGQKWGHVIWDGPPDRNKTSTPWTIFARKAYMQMQNAGAEHAHHMAKTCTKNYDFYVYLPQSIWAVSERQTQQLHSNNGYCSMCWLLPSPIQMDRFGLLEARVQCLWDLGKIFRDIIAEPPDNEKAVATVRCSDAKASTSKYQLLLSARRAGRGVGGERLGRS